MIRWKPLWMRLPENGFHEMQLRQAKKPKFQTAGFKTCLAGGIGSIGSGRTYSRFSRKSGPDSNIYALVPLTKAEPDASAEVVEHRQNVDDVLRSSWKEIDGFGPHENCDSDDGGFDPTTYGELTPSGARHLARAIGLDEKPCGSIWAKVMRYGQVWLNCEGKSEVGLNYLSLNRPILQSLTCMITS